MDLQLTEQVTYLFISHDLRVVGYLSDRIAVMYLGKLMEVGPAGIVFARPAPSLHRSARLVRAEHRRGEPDSYPVDGEIPSAATPPPGCVFHTRCPRRLDNGLCEGVEPPLVEVAPGHLMACHIELEELRRLQAVEVTIRPATSRLDPPPGR